MFAAFEEGGFRSLALSGCPSQAAAIEARWSLSAGDIFSCCFCGEPG